MSEEKWLDFAGFMNGCIYGLENNNCPYQKFHQLDQFQKLEYILTTSDEDATRIIHCCENHKKNCKKPNQALSLRSLDLVLMA